MAGIEEWRSSAAQNAEANSTAIPATAGAKNCHYFDN